MKRKILSNILYAFLCVLLLNSCKKEVTTVLTTESTKDIAGTWKIVKISRNGEDLTQRLDLSNFKISFNVDGTYTIEPGMAFPVYDPGTYKLNDPQYPFTLSLTPNNKEELKIKAQFPIINGKRQISLTLSPGCTTNSYQYNLDREN